MNLLDFFPAICYTPGQGKYNCLLFASKAYMDTDNKSILEELYADSGEFDRERVVRALKAVLTIQRDEHKVFFKNDNMRADDKILAYALAKRLLKSEGAADSSSVSGGEIKSKTGVKPGTVDSTIKRLREEEKLLVGSGKNYEIPWHKITTVIERLEKYAKI